MPLLWERLHALGRLSPGHVALVRSLEEKTPDSYLDEMGPDWVRKALRGLVNRLKVVEAPEGLVLEVEALRETIAPKPGGDCPAAAV